MTKALKTYIPILVLLLAAILASCDSAETRQRIAAADSLAEASPRAAIALADSLAPDVASRSSRMRLALIKAKAQNKLGMRLHKDTISMLASYYDSHGSANERMLADYIQGWACLDNDDTPKALHYFHSAAEDADTAANDCDYKTLHKVHVWTAQLLMDNDVLAEAMNENRLAMKYALKAKDTLNALITMEQQANIYDGMDVADSAFAIRRGLYALYMKHGYPRQAAISLGPLVNKLAKLGEFSEAKRSLGIYESKSGLFDGNGNIEQGRESYYGGKGFYFFYANMLDSAEYYFRRCLKTTSVLSNVKDSYKALARVYKKRHNTDSVAKYAELACIMTDSLHAVKNTTHLRQMQAVYNYSQYKYSAEVLRKEVVVAKLISALIFLTALFVAVAISLYIKRKRRLRKMEMLEYQRSISELEKTKRELVVLSAAQQKEMQEKIEEKEKEIDWQRLENDKYRHNIIVLEKARNELIALSNKQKEQICGLIKEKDKEIERLKQENSTVSEDRKNVAEKYSDEPVVKILRQHARKDFKRMNAAESDSLKALFVDNEALRILKNIVNDSEYQVCLLVRIGLTPKEISVLTGMSASNISNIRSRLMVKITGCKGSPKAFDKYIMSL